MFGCQTDCLRSMHKTAFVMDKEKIRADKFFWAIRLFKSRKLSCEACEKGKVRLDGQSIKPSRMINVGEIYEIHTSEKNWVIKILKLISMRVSYKEAVLCYEDLTPDEEKERIAYLAASFHTGKRLSKIGHPTKKQRRDLDDFMQDEDIAFPD